MRYYHGTRHNIEGDTIVPHAHTPHGTSNYDYAAVGDPEQGNRAYAMGSEEAALLWAMGPGSPRTYEVEPVGEVEDDRAGGFRSFDGDRGQAFRAPAWRIVSGPEYALPGDTRPLVLDGNVIGETTDPLQSQRERRARGAMGWDGEGLSDLLRLRSNTESGYLRERGYEHLIPVNRALTEARERPISAHQFRLID